MGTANFLVFDLANDLRAVEKMQINVEQEWFLSRERKHFYFLSQQELSSLFLVAINYER